jgi:hypothetical protein
MAALPQIDVLDYLEASASDVRMAIGVDSSVPYVIVISGQSNAAGAHDGGPNPADSNVHTWDGVTGEWGGSDYTGLPWSRLNPDGNNSKNNYALARAHYIHDTTQRPVYIIFEATGGSSIDEWVGSGDTSTHYASLDAKVVDALASDELAGITTVDEIIWAQGEADAADDFATHLANFTALIEQFRAEDWCQSHTPIYVMSPSDLHDRYEPQEAMKYYCSKVDMWCLWVPASGLEEEDSTHFSGAGLWEAGYHRIKDVYPAEWPTSIFRGRNSGPANPADDTVITTFKNLVSADSATSQAPVSSHLANGAISWGFECEADANYSFMLGYQCVSDNSAQYGLLAGRSMEAVAAGRYYGGFGYQNTISAYYTFVAGRGHTIADQGGAAIGLYSEYATAEADDVIFQIGIGPSSGSRKNALTARKSGKLEAKHLPQYADDTAAGVGGLTSGDIYQTSTGELRIKI